MVSKTNWTPSNNVNPSAMTSDGRPSMAACVAKGVKVSHHELHCTPEQTHAFPTVDGHIGKKRHGGTGRRSRRHQHAEWLRIKPGDPVGGATKTEVPRGPGGTATELAPWPRPQLARPPPYSATEAHLRPNPHGRGSNPAARKCPSRSLKYQLGGARNCSSCAWPLSWRRLATHTQTLGSCFSEQ